MSTTDPGQYLLDYIARMDEDTLGNFDLKRRPGHPKGNGLRGAVFAYRDSLVPQFKGWECDVATRTYTNGAATVLPRERSGWFARYTVAGVGWSAITTDVEAAIAAAEGLRDLFGAARIGAAAPSGYGPWVAYTAGVRPQWLDKEEGIVILLRDGTTRDHSDGCIYESAWSCGGACPLDTVGFARRVGKEVFTPWSLGDEVTVPAGASVIRVFRNGNTTRSKTWAPANGRGEGGVVAYRIVS